MVREFKIRRTPFKVWLGVVIVIVAIVLMALHTENYWNLSPIVLPVLLLIDEQMTRIQVQENGDIWLKRGFSGSIKAYGVMRIVLRKKDSLLKGRVTVYYTKGFLNFDPADLKGFWHVRRSVIPMLTIVKNNHPYKFNDYEVSTGYNRWRSGWIYSGRNGWKSRIECGFV